MLADDVIVRGVVVKGFALQKRHGIVALAAVLFGEFSMELSDVDILMTVDTKATTIMCKDKATRWLRRLCRQKFARLSSMTSGTRFHF